MPTHYLLGFRLQSCGTTRPCDILKLLWWLISKLLLVSLMCEWWLTTKVLMKMKKLQFWCIYHNVGFCGLNYWDLLEKMGLEN